MATYPSFGQSIESEPVLLDGMVNDRADNGDLKSRSFWPAAKIQFNIVHYDLTPTNLADLRTFYNANRTVPFNFVWADDGLTYSCLFMANTLKWKRMSNLNGGSYRVEVSLLT